MSNYKNNLNGIVPDELKGKFRQAKGHIKKISFIKGLALLIGCLIVSFVIAFILDRVLRMEPFYRLIVLIFILVSAFFVFMWSLALPVFRRYSARSIAVSVEAANPDLGDSLLTAVELTEEAQTGNLKTSLELARAHAQKTSEYATKIDFSSIIPFRTVTKTLVFAIVSLAVIAGFYIARTPLVVNAFERLIRPYSGPEVFTYTKIKVEPGNAYVKKGDDIEISALLSGVVPEKGYLIWKNELKKWEKITIGQKDKKLLHKFSSILTPVSYKFYAGDAFTDAYKITPVVPPAITAISPKIIYPEYTHLAPKVLANSGGSFSVINGSKVIITAFLNKPCKEAYITWIDGEKYPMTINDSVIYSDELSINQNGLYSLALIDDLGFTNNNPTFFRVEALRDIAPTIVIERPPQYNEAIPDAVALITYSIVDDFGVEKIWMDYTINKKPEAEEADILPEHIINGTANIRLEETGATSVHADYSFLLSELALKSGDIISLKIKAQDFDNLTGPNIGESDEIRIKIITHEESFERIINDQEDIQRRIKLLINKQVENEDVVEQLAKTSKEQNDLNKSDKEILTSSRKTQEEITESDKDIASDVEKVVGKMQTNPLIDLRSIIQMNDIKKALDNLAEGEMANATAEMKNAEKASNSASRAQNLDKAGKHQDEIIKKLEAIDKQLSKLKDEQVTASLANMGRRLAKEQDQNVEDTEEARKELSGMLPEDMSNQDKRKLKKLVDKEKKLIEQLEQLEQRMQKISRQAKAEETEGNIKEAMRQMKEEKIQEDMKDAEESLRSNHLNKAMDAQKNASKKLWNMVKSLEQKDQQQLSTEFQNMEIKMREQIAEIDRIIEIQTQLLDETLILPTGDQTDPLNDRHLISFFTLSSSESKLKSRCDEFTQKLQAIFENLVLIDIDPISPLKKASVLMEEASVALVELRQPSAVDAEKEALKELDKAREELAKAISKMMQEAQMQQMMQQMGILDEMIEKQLKINKETKEVDERIKPDQEIPDTLQRLSKKLSRLQKELADTADSLKEQLRQMKEISELMGEVSKLLDEVKTGKKTQAIQEEIIEKLVSVLMQMQMQMSGSAQAMGMGLTGGSGGGGNRSGVQLPVQRRDRPEGISDDQWAKLSEKLKKELLDAWSEEYPSRFRALLNIYYRRLAEEEIR